MNYLRQIFKRFKKTSRVLVAVLGLLLISQAFLPALNVLAGPTPRFFDHHDGNFYKIKNITTGQNWTDNVSVNPGDELQFRIHFLNDIPGSIAYDTRVRADLASQTVAGNLNTTGNIGCKNANPATYANGATLQANQVLSLDYVSGSTYMRKGDGTGQYYNVNLPDGILGSPGTWPTRVGDVMGSDNVDWQGWAYFTVRAGSGPAAPGVSVTPDNEKSDYAGQTVTYENHIVTNTGNVSDSYDITATSENGWTAVPSITNTGTMAPGATRNFTVNVTIPNGANPGTEDDTIVRARSPGTGVTGIATDTTTVLPPDQHPSVSLTPNNSRDGYAGQKIAYRHTVTNTGDVSDNYNLTATSAHGWSAVPRINNTGTLAPGAERSFYVDVTISAGATVGTVDATNVYAESPDTGVNATAVDTTTVIPRDEAHLVVTETVSKSSVQRDNPDASARDLDYQIIVRNDGTKTATDTVLTSDLSNNLWGNVDFTDYGGGSLTGQNLVYDIGNISAGSSVTRNFSVRAHSNLADLFSLRNRSSATYGDSAATSLSSFGVLAAGKIATGNEVRTTVHGSALSLSVTDNRLFAERGEVLHYTVDLNNIGSGIAYVVSVVNVVPDNLENITNISDGGSYNAATREITWNFATLNGNVQLSPGNPSGYDLTFDATVSNTTPDGFILLDEATASANNVVSVNANDTTEVRLMPELNLTELVDKADVQRDDTAATANEVVYTLRAENTGEGTARDAVMRTDLTSVLGSATVIDPMGGTISGNYLEYPAADINPGDTLENGFRVRVLGSAIDEAVMQNNFSLTYDLAAVSLSAADSTSNTVATTVHAPYLSISKTDNLDETEPGQTLNYEITIVNSGTGNAYNVDVVDSLPAYLTNVTNISDGGTYDNVANEITWADHTIDGSFAPLGTDWSDNQTVSFEATVEASAPDEFVLENIASITANNIPAIDAKDETTIQAEPYLNLDKTVLVNGSPSSITHPGELLTYEISYSNTGKGIANNVVIVDTLPAYINYIDPSASAGGVYNSGARTITWNLGDLAVSGSGSVTFNAIVDSNVPHNSVISNLAEITADDGYHATARVDLTAKRLPGLFVEKRVDKANTTPGDVLTYTVIYGNNSDEVAAVNAVLTDELSSFTTYVDGSATHSGSYDATNHSLTWNVGTLAPNSQYQVTYQVKIKDDVPNGTIITNTATLTASFVDPVSYTINSLSETGSVSGSTTTVVTYDDTPNWPENLTKSGGGLIALLAGLLTLLTFMALAIPQIKKHLTGFRG